MTAPNPVLPGSGVFNTRRTLDGIFHLRPDPEVNQRIEFALAYAAGKHNIDLYSFCSLSNHIHGTHGDPDGVTRSSAET